MRFEFQLGIGLAFRKEVYRLRGAIASSVLRPPGAQIDLVSAAELRGVAAFCQLELGGD